MPTNRSFQPVPPQRARPYFGFRLRANHVSRPSAAPRERIHEWGAIAAPAITLAIRPCASCALASVSWVSVTTGPPRSRKTLNPQPPSWLCTAPSLQFSYVIPASTEERGWQLSLPSRRLTRQAVRRRLIQINARACQSTTLKNTRAGHGQKPPGGRRPRSPSESLGRS